jgi:ATP-dependent Clp protease ATP-binding subunit ClpC
MRHLESVQSEKESAISAQQYELAAEYRDQEAKLRQKLEKLESGWHSQQNNEKPVVTAEDIAHVVSLWTGIPVMRIAEEESARLLKMEEALQERVKGQQEPISIVSKAVRRARAGLKDPRRPIGSFIFLGPTGVGKTELVRALAEFMFGSEESMVKIDMSEFMERHSVARLVGAPPGYIGYEEGGQLTEAVRRKSYSVILLDEIEKAHPEVFNILLQIMDDGRLTDAKGRKVDFRNTIIIMTSNVGADLIRKETKVGFQTGKNAPQDAEHLYETMKEKVLSEMKKLFRPEFLNRIDATVVFRSLGREQIRQIVELMLGRTQNQLTEQRLTIEVTDAAKDLLVEKGFDEVFGARPMRRAIQTMIEDPLAEGLLHGRFQPGDSVHIDRQGEDLTMDTKVLVETA